LNGGFHDRVTHRAIADSARACRNRLSFAKMSLTIFAGVMRLGLSFLTPAQNNPAPKERENNRFLLRRYL
jgi:hypothetical protein